MEKKKIVLQQMVFGKLDIQIKKKSELKPSASHHTKQSSPPSLVVSEVCMFTQWNTIEK